MEREKKVKSYHQEFKTQLVKKARKVENMARAARMYGFKHQTASTGVQKAKKALERNQQKEKLWT